MRPSSPAASPVLLVAKDGNELPLGDNVTLDLGENEVDGEDALLGEVADLPLVPRGSGSLSDRFSDLTGFTRIHFGVARDAAKSIKQAVDVKKQVKVKIRRDFSIVPGGLYRDIV